MRSIIKSRRIYFRLCEKCTSYFILKNFSSNNNKNNIISKSSSSHLPLKLNYKAVFMGSDNFSLPSLIALTRILSPQNVSVVVSNEHNLVGKYATKNSLKMFHWNDFKSEKYFSSDTEGFDLGVVASFGYLIPERIINRFPLGILNVHASLLPRWRGASPIAHAVIFGDSISGISIMQIAPHKFDVGPVLEKTSVPVHPHVRTPELTTILSQVGADTLANVISDLPRYISNPLSQDENCATLSPKLIPEMADVKWSSKSAVNVYNLFRGLSGVFKLKTNFLDRKVDLDQVGLVSFEKESLQEESKQDTQNYSVNIVNSQKAVVDIYTDFKSFYHSSTVINCEISLPENSKPGQIVFSKQQDVLYVKCAEYNEIGEIKPKISSWIFVRKVKIGTKWMSAKDFQNGFLSKCKPENRCFIQVPDSTTANLKEAIKNKQ